MSAQAMTQGSGHSQATQAVVRRRKAVNAVVVAFAYAMTAAGIFWLAAILFELTVSGIGAINLEIFTRDTPATGSAGGLRNAIVGSLVLTALAIAIAAPVGLMAGTFLIEYGRGSRLTKAIQFVNDMLLSAPSIIIGLFVYEAIVLQTGGFSGWAGAVALSIVALPIVVRTTQDMLLLVPNGLREAAFALGAPRWKVITTVSYRAVFQGLLTGFLLAISRVSGETAPLLFTVTSNQFWSLNLNRPIANLPVFLAQNATGAFDDLKRLAWGGAFLITLSVLLLNIAARYIAGLNTVKK